MRKTISVDEVKACGNKILRESTTAEETREGVIAFIEHVLLQSGNYKGFRYLPSSEVPEGTQPGIALAEGLAASKNIYVFPDPTRRYYF
jgi:hypothetical protein